jgi:adenylate cyclase
LADVAAATLDASTTAHQSSARRLGFAVLVLGLLCVLCAPFFADLIDHDAPRPKAGAVSYAGHGPLTRPVELAGEWRLVWRSAPAPGLTAVIEAPGRWVDRQVGAITMPLSGAATYHLSIRDLPAGRYTLFVPKLYAGSRVAVNGRVLSERGTFGLTPQDTAYLVRSHEVTFEADGRPLDLAIDISSFHHRDNGLEVTPVLGLQEPMSRWITLDWLRSFLLVASLLLLACYGVVVFLFRRRDRASLYFAVACVFLIPLIGVFSHDNLLLLAHPGLDFTAMMGVQYLTSLVALSAVLAYTHELFPKESPRLAFWSLQALMALLFLADFGLWLLGDTLTMSKLSQWALGLRAAVFVYILAVVFVACVRRRDGAVVFLLGMSVFVACLIYTDLVTNTVIPRLVGLDLLPIGTLLLLFSHIVILAERWSMAIGSAEQTNSDLRRLLDVNISISSEMRLEALLTKIVTVTSKVIHADRTSLFLHDPKTDELYSVVAEGVEEAQIRFPSPIGLAGWVFTRGEAVNLKNAYDDPRFNREVDDETGYRTQSVLAVPVTTRDGRRVGVMQALNREGGSRFGDADLERMSAFAAQAAIAIENATLFAEVASERNYNESILRSMSSGVVTLDRDNKVAKLNAAACAILGFERDDLVGRDARAFLRATNPWLLSEIDAVSRSGQPKALLDVDVKTARGDTISANLSIVSLVAEGEQVGLLLLIEDISEGKRLQGAMRRFMTQKVMDQVLSRGDDRLFGAACRASVLFADIRNFTALAEQMQPRQTVDMLNEIFTELFEAVAAYDGVLDKFIGDAIMAVYGAPLSSGRDPQNAVESAVAMMRMVTAINDKRRARGMPDVRLGVGIASGEVVAGTIGSPKRMDYTVIGDSVNLAARLEAITKIYRVGVVVCEDTAATVADAHQLRELDTIRVRGRQRPSRIFQVLTEDAPVNAEALAAYSEGRRALDARRWKEAQAAFEAAVAADPSDRPSAMMLDRARILARRPPPPDWDGVWDTAEAA